MIALLLVAIVARASELGSSNGASKPVAPATKVAKDIKMPSGFVNASVDSSEKNMCRVINESGHGNPGRFDTKNPYGLCAPTWKSSTPEWFKADIRSEIQKVGTSDYKLVSRSEFMREKELKLLNQAQKESLLSLAKEFREKAAVACCAANAVCLKAMRDVRMNVCESEADRDATRDDSCEGTAGEYELTNIEQAKIVIASRSSSVAAVNEAHALLGTMPVDTPVSGEIEFSPYTDKNGKPLSSPATLRHEFGHACSFIQRQIAAKLSKEAGRSLTTKSCAMDSLSYAKTYGSILKNTGLNAHVETCLVDLASQSVKKTSSTYLPNSCPAKKVEEATAEAFALATSPLIPEAFPNRACIEKRPSRIHAAPVDVFTCLVKGDGGFRKRFAEMFRCQ